MIGLIAKPYAMTVQGVGGAGWGDTFPVTNLLNNDYARVAQSTQIPAGQATSVHFDLGASLPVDTVALLWSNAVAADFAVVFVSDSTDFGPGSYISPPFSMQTGGTTRDSLGRWKALFTFPTQTGRYIRFDIYSAAGGQFVISRAVVAKSVQFAIGPQKATLGGKDLNANVTTEIGETRSQEDPGLIRPVISLSFDYAKQSEMEQLLGAYTLGLGVAKPMLICSDLTSQYIQDNLAFGRLEKVVELESEQYDVWSFEAVVTSLGV